MKCMTYQQLEEMRILALGMGLHAQWFGELDETESWLRVSHGCGELVLCWFPGRKPILSVSLQTDVALDVAHAALEMVALYATLTSGLEPEVDVEAAP